MSYVINPTLLYDIELTYQRGLEELQKNVDLCDAELKRLELNSKLEQESIKNAKKKLFISKSVKSTYILNTNKQITEKLINELWTIESAKVISSDIRILDESYTDVVKSIYLFLRKHGENNSRYIKLPKNWMNIGYTAGLLEDLVVVMRILSRMNISNNQMITIQTLITGFINYMKIKESNGIHQFSFFKNLIEKFDSPIIIENIIIDAIKSQGESKRIGSYKKDYISICDKYPVLQKDVLYIYAIQGIYDLNYDPRVTHTLLSSDLMFPKYAIHFTQTKIAHNIYHNIQTNTQRKRYMVDDSTVVNPIITGSICKFDRHIHAITAVEKVNGYFVISDKFKSIRDRMSHGITNDFTRLKYEAGLIIDVEMLAKYYEAKEQNILILNEINTLLISDDVPRDCIIYLIETESELDRFWKVI